MAMLKNTLIIALFTLTIMTETAVSQLNTGPRGTIAGVVTPAFFNRIINQVGGRCPAKGFYTRKGFIDAAQSFQAYKGTVAKREIAAIFAQFSHETGRLGATTRRINGGECNGGNPAAVTSRVNRYLEFCRRLGVTPGTNLRC